MNQIDMKKIQWSSAN